MAVGVVNVFLNVVYLSCHYLTSGIDFVQTCAQFALLNLQSGNLFAQFRNAVLAVVEKVQFLLRLFFVFCHIDNQLPDHGHAGLSVCAWSAVVETDVQRAEKLPLLHVLFLALQGSEQCGLFGFSLSLHFAEFKSEVGSEGFLVLQFCIQ